MVMAVTGPLWQSILTRGVCWLGLHMVTVPVRWMCVYRWNQADYSSGHG